MNEFLLVFPHRLVLVLLQIRELFVFMLSNLHQIVSIVEYIFEFCPCDRAKQSSSQERAEVENFLQADPSLTKAIEEEDEEEHITLSTKHQDNT